MKAPPMPPREQMIDARLLRRVALATLAVAAILIIAMWPSIQAMQFPDPDDELRLVQVRDWLAGQAWFDVTLYRVDAPGGGVPMHWSRLVDLPLAFFILLLTPVVGVAWAESITIVLVPLLTLAVIMLLGARLSKRLLGPDHAGFALLVLALTVPMLHQIRPLRIDHHGWQIALALLAANALFARSARSGAWVAGLALAVWLTISLEALPLTAIVMAILTLRWLRDQNPQWLVHGSAALASGSAFLLVTTRLGQASPDFCDTLEPAHVLAFGFGAIGAGLVSRLSRWGVVLQIALLGGVGAGALALLLAVDGSCAGGGFGGLDPLVKRTWYDSVREGLPIWNQDPVFMLQVMVPGVFALWAVHRLAMAPGGDRRLWSDYGLLLGGALAIAILVSRAGSVSSVLGAIPLAALVGTWYERVKGAGRPVHRALHACGLVLVLIPSSPVALASSLSTQAENRAGDTGPTTTCDYPAAAPVLRRLGDGEVLAPIDIAPWILSVSDLSVVATGHHRGNRAMRVVIEAFLSSPEEARRVLAARGTRYVVFCDDLAEPSIYRTQSPDGFAAQLMAGRVPAWLDEVDTDAGRALHIWRIRDQGSAKPAR